MTEFRDCKSYVILHTLHCKMARRYDLEHRENKPSV